MSFLDDVGGYLSTAQSTLNQAGGVLSQAQQLQRQISGRAGTPTPPTVDEPLHGLTFAPIVMIGIIGLLIVAVAFGSRR